MPDARTVRLAHRFEARIATVADRAASSSGAAWSGLASYDEAQIAEYARTVGPALDRARTVAADTAGGFYATLVGRRPVPIDPRRIRVPNELREPFIAHWTALAAGRAYPDAVAAGLSRAQAIGRNLVISVARRTGDHVLGRLGIKVVFWERVPEGDACPWCELVSADQYGSAEAADFGHDRCQCTAVPITE